MFDKTFTPNAARSKVRSVKYLGTDAIAKGRGVCYDRDWTGTLDTGDTIEPTDDFYGRDCFVRKCQSGMNNDFAGVTTKDYPAKANGQMIDIYQPGGIAEVSLMHNVTLASSYVTCVASGDADIGGRFGPAGLKGRGTAQLLQTVSAGVIIASYDGGAGVSSTTLTDGDQDFGSTGLDVKIGDSVLIFASIAGTGSSAIGRFTVASTPADSATTLTLSTAPTTATHIGYIIYRTAPVALAYLMDGEESGCAEFLCPEGAITPMVGGATFLLGGTNVGVGAYTLADGAYGGQQKLFQLLATPTGGAFTISANSNWLDCEDHAAQAEEVMAAASDFLHLEWVPIWTAAGAADGFWVTRSKVIT